MASKLVDGCIPAGQACPFLDECRLRMDRCPTAEQPKSVPFSCAAARMADMIHKEKLPADSLLGRVWAGKK